MQEVKNIRQFIKDNNVGTIFLDCDGVIMASCQAMVDILNKQYGTNYKGSDITDWNFTNCFPNLKEEDMERLFASTEFFTIVKPIKGVVKFLKEYKDKIIIITKSTSRNLYWKNKWFADLGFYDMPIIGLPLYLDKSYINMQTLSDKATLFIDDNTDNLIDSNADYIIQFREYKDDKQREWQKDWNEYVMYSWK